MSARTSAARGLCIALCIAADESKYAEKITAYGGAEPLADPLDLDDFDVPKA